MERDEERRPGCGWITLGSSILILALLMPFFGLPLGLLAAVVAIVVILARSREGGS